MPYHPNDPLYQTPHSKVQSFKDFNPKAEKEQLGKMKRNFKKPGETHQIAGERKHKWNTITKKIDDLSVEEVEDKMKNLTEGSELTNYMFFKNLETIYRLSKKMLGMDQHKIDKMLMEHDWARDHVATSKDDIEEVFNWLASTKS